MHYRLRTLLIVLTVGPMVLAGAWFASSSSWSDEAILLAAIAYALPYWMGIVVLLAMNPRRVSAWVIAVILAILWPSLFFMSLLQLAVVIPVWSVILTNGGDLGRPLTRQSVYIAFVVTLAFFAWIFCSALVHGP